MLDGLVLEAIKVELIRFIMQSQGCQKLSFLEDGLLGSMGNRMNHVITNQAGKLKQFLGEVGTSVHKILCTLGSSAISEMFLGEVSADELNFSILMSSPEVEISALDTTSLASTSVGSLR